MKKLFVLCLFFALLLQMASASAMPFLPAEGILRVNAYLREQPTTKARATRTILKGTSVIITEVVGAWLHVDVGNTTGYIRSDLFVDNTMMASPFADPGSAYTIPSYVAPQDLKLGAHGEAVQHLQDGLVTLGYNALSKNGIYDDDTEDMVKAFQVNYNINADGAVGKETRDALDYALHTYYQTVNALQQRIAEQQGVTQGALQGETSWE